MNEFSASDEML